MKAKVYLLLLLPYLILNCATRAPTDYELDRRAGLTPTEDLEKKTEPELRLLPKSVKHPKHPARKPAQIEKVWVYDQELDNGYWLQGTFVYLEVSSSEWDLESKE